MAIIIKIIEVVCLGYLIALIVFLLVSELLALMTPAGHEGPEGFEQDKEAEDD